MYFVIFLFICLFIIGFFCGITCTVFASRIAPWTLQMFLKMGRKLGDEKILISGWGPFAKPGFLTWWIRIGGIFLSAFSVYALYQSFTEALRLLP